jgi:hypothetical protein
MFRFEGPKSKEVNLSSLEQPSLRLKETFSKAQKTSELGKKMPNPLATLRSSLEEEYALHNQESYDCHSFVFAVLRREFDIDTLPVLNFKTPDRADFETEVGWEEELLKNALNSAEYDEYQKVMLSLTEKIYENSDHVSVPKTKRMYDFKGDELELSKELNNSIIEETTKSVLKQITNSPASRVILISNGQGEEFYDAHSLIVLGIEKGAKDALVIEKAQIGSSIEVRKLSDVITEWSTHYAHLTELEINICRKPIKELLKG